MTTELYSVDLINSLKVHDRLWEGSLLIERKLLLL